MQTAGVAASLGLHPNPIGTPDELRREGFGLQHVGSCAPPVTGVRGCAHYHKCAFKLTRNGGFRDKGPRNIGFFHETHEGHRRQEFMACFTFMQVLYERMRAGVRDREDGKRGEIIRIICQQGDTIRPKHTVDLNEGTLLPPKWARKNDPIVVPAFPRPHEQGGNSYDAVLMREEQARQRAEDDQSFGAPVDAKDMEPEPEGEVVDLDKVLAAPASGPASVAAPVERKPK